MARKSITKSKPVTKIRKYQTGSMYQQVTNPYYISGSYREQAKLEADRAMQEAARFGDYSQARAIEAEVRKKEREAEEKKAKEELLLQTAEQKRQEERAFGQEVASTAGNEALGYTKKMLAEKTAKETAEKQATDALATAGNTAAAAVTPAANTVAQGIAPTITAQAARGSGMEAARVFGSNLIDETGAVVVPQAGTSAASTGAGVGAAASGAGAGAAAGNAGLLTANMSGLAAAGIGLGLTGAGYLVQRKMDTDPTKYSKKEGRQNALGDAFKGAGTGFGAGAAAGTIIPGVGNVVGGIVGGLAGFGIGLAKGIGENKRMQAEAGRYAEEEARIKKLREEEEARRRALIAEQTQLMANAANRGFIGSRLQGLNTGFGYNTSTNMNTQPTSSFYGKTGGKMYELGGYRVPGGQVVPIGDDAVEFIGNQHSEKKIDGVSGIRLDAKTEVENKETMKKNMKMANGGESDYFFSSDHKAMPVKGGKFLGYTGKSYADIHKAIERSNKPDYVKDIESRMLAKDQEATAYKRGEKDRGPEQIAMYGGIHKYQTGKFKLGKVEGTAENTEAPQSFEDINKVIPMPKNPTPEEGEKYWKAVQDYCAQFPGTRGVCFDHRAYLEENKDWEAESEKPRYIFSKDKFKKFPYHVQAYLASSDPGGGDPIGGGKLEASGFPATYERSRKVNKPGITKTFLVDTPEEIEQYSKRSKELNEKMKNFDKNYGPSTWVKSNKRGGVRKYQTGDVREEEALLGNEVELQGDAMGTWGTPVVREDLSGVKPSDNVVVVEEEQGVPAGQVVYKKGRKYITPGYINTINGIRGRKEELEGLEDGIYKQRYFTKTAEADGASPFNRYEEGEIERRAQINGYNPYLEGTPGYIRVQKFLDERNRVNAEAAKSAKTYEDLSGTKPPVTAEQSANAQSNANASNVTVRDQNQANAQAPSAQTSVAPGGTTNSAGQAAANAALFPEGRRAVTKDEYGESTSMKGVPSGQKEGKVFFGNVTESEYESMKAANPWFDFSNFDPSKRDHKNPDGSYGSSDVYKFQKAYNEHVRKGEKLKEDGKFGEQTATSRLHVADLKDIPMKGLDQPLKKAEVDLTKDTGLPKADKTTNEELEVANLKRGVNGSLLAGLGQLIPVGYALARPYKTEGNLPRMKSPGKVGAGSVRGAILPRVNMNAERAAAERNTVAIKNAIQNTNAGPGGIAAMMAANTAQGNQMLAIANQEQEANKQLAAEEARMGQQASQFNVETGLRAGMANMQSQLAVDQANLEAGIKEAALKIDEKRYKREEILGALDTAAARIAGIVKDEKSYRAQERLAKAIDNTGSYDRFTIYEQLQKEAKKKDSPYYGKTDAELRKIASNTYNEVLGRMGLEGEETAKTGGKRKYTSRLGELSRNKKSFNI